MPIPRRSLFEKGPYQPALHAKLNELETVMLEFLSEEALLSEKAIKALCTRANQTTDPQGAYIAICLLKAGQIFEMSPPISAFDHHAENAQKSPRSPLLFFMPSEEITTTLIDCVFASIDPAAAALIVQNLWEKQVDSLSILSLVNDNNLAIFLNPDEPTSAFDLFLQAITDAHDQDDMNDIPGQHTTLFVNKLTQLCQNHAHDPALGRQALEQFYMNHEHGAPQVTKNML